MLPVFNEEHLHPWTKLCGSFAYTGKRRRIHLFFVLNACCSVWLICFRFPPSEAVVFL